MFSGLSAFPITPADSEGRVDTVALSHLVQRLVKAEVASIALLGTTGTYAYLNRAERLLAVEAAASCIQGRTPLIVGVGALRTDDAQDLARDAEAAGANGLLLAPMSYTPLTEEEVFQHFVAVAGSTDLPLCIYNNPATTHFAFGDALLERLARVPGIAALKTPAPAPAEAQVRHEALRTKLPTAFAIGYSGDWHASDVILSGGNAWYSVIGGLLPAPALSLFRAAKAGDKAEVAHWNARFQPLWDLFRELSSLRVIYAASDILGICRALPPRPILPLAPAECQRVATALDTLNP